MDQIAPRSTYTGNQGGQRPGFNTPTGRPQPNNPGNQAGPAPGGGTVSYHSIDINENNIIDLRNKAKPEESEAELL